MYADNEVKFGEVNQISFCRFHFTSAVILPLTGYYYSILCTSIDCIVEGCRYCDWMHK